MQRWKKCVSNEIKKSNQAESAIVEEATAIKNKQPYRERPHMINYDGQVTKWAQVISKSIHLSLLNR